MRKIAQILLLVAATLVAPDASAQTLAPAPPMGWNSWDAYGFTLDEAQYKANAEVLASLKPEGWTYAVIDMGWYMNNPLGEKTADQGYQLDGNGRLIPSPKLFPSSAGGAGFKPLADWVHSQGLKFGIHIMRGIPREAVAQNLPIADSSFRAADAADTSDTCPWNDGDYGIRDNAAGQAYYDSEVKRFAEWGVDYIKIDCIADHPYKGSEIRQIAEAIKRSGRPIVLSLSPGPTNLSHAAEVGQYSQLWRIADDIWDGWSFPPPWPNGLESAFGNLAKWSPYAKPGNWPDADMLPFGSLIPHPGWGDPRQSRLTPDEERTMFTLWAITRSPLFLGANLTKLDDFTRSLITNRAVIAVNQTAWESHPMTDLPKGFDKARVWLASAGPRTKPIHYLAVFNLDDQPASLKAMWSKLGLRGARHAPLDLWSGVRLPASRMLEVTLPAHGSAIYRID